LALDIAGFAQGLAKRGNLECRIICRPAAEEPDHRHRRLLGARREWPGDRQASDHFDKNASSHAAPGALAQADTP